MLPLVDCQEPLPNHHLFAPTIIFLYPYRPTLLGWSAPARVRASSRYTVTAQRIHAIAHPVTSECAVLPTSMRMLGCCRADSAALPKALGTVEGAHPAQNAGQTHSNAQEAGGEALFREGKLQRGALLAGEKPTRR